MRVRWSVLFAAALLLGSGCNQASIPPVISSSTPTVTSTASLDRIAVYDEAAAFLQSFLASWQKNGLYAAGQKYLDPSMRPNQPQGNPVLIEGNLTRTQPGEWVSADHFTVLADLDLRFSGSAGAWGNGTNTRFVTFVRSSASAPYQITFATSP
jgi:hypothetical protein